MKKITTNGIITIMLIASIIMVPTNVRADETWDPMIYDSPEVGTPPGNDNEVIDYYEAINAIQDYFDGIITYSQAMDVIALYEGGNVIVDDDADPSWYDATHVKTIQEGINNASIRNIVFVHNGTYFENVVVNKSVSLIGENINNTIVDGGESGDVVFISADEVTISGFTIQNGGHESFPFNDACIDIISDCNTISDNIIINAFNGIFLNVSSSNNSISFNKIMNNDYSGIFFHGSNNNNIFENHLMHNYNAMGSSYAYESYITKKPYYNNIINNDIEDNDYGMSFHDLKNSNISNNNIINNLDNRIILYDSDNNTVYKNNAEAIDIAGISNNNNIIENTLVGGLILSEASMPGNNIVINNTIDGKELLYLNEVSDVTIDGTKLVGQVYLINCDKITIQDQTISYVIYDEAITLWNTSNSCIKNNDLTDGTAEKGIILLKSNNNIISGNDVLGAIILDRSHINKIENNKIISGSNTCISLFDSDNNSIIENNLIDSVIGLECSGSNNQFYHNNFINNTENAMAIGNNIWYNTISNEGNYWDDYEGVDSDSDGIGDTPYNISGGDNKDYYPLMGPYSPPVQTELEVSIETGFVFSFKKVSAKVENKGDSDANNVNLSIYVEYGLLKKKINSSIEFNVLESDSVSELLTLDGLHGFGKIKVTAEVKADNANAVNTTASGWMLGRFIFLS